MNIPEILKVKIRTKNEYGYNKGPLNPPYLSYFTYIDEKKVLRKEKSWKDWGDKTDDDILNVPREGFIIKDTEQRSREWFGTGRSVFRVIHPDNKNVFEITANNLLEIIDSCVIRMGTIMSPCVIAYDGAQMSLIPTLSPIYQEYVNVTAKINSGTITPSKLQIGHIYTNRKGEKFIYYGKLWSMSSFAASYQQSSGSFFSSKNEQVLDITVHFRQYHYLKYVNLPDNVSYYRNSHFIIQVAPALYETSEPPVNLNLGQSIAELLNYRSKNPYHLTAERSHVTHIMNAKPSNSDIEYLRSDILRLADLRKDEPYDHHGNNDSINELYKKYMISLYYNSKDYHRNMVMGTLDFKINDK